MRKPENFLSCLQPRRQWWRLPSSSMAGAADLRAGFERRKDRAAHLMLSPSFSVQPAFRRVLFFSRISKNKRSPAADDLQFFSFALPREFTMTPLHRLAPLTLRLMKTAFLFLQTASLSFHFSFLRCFRSTFCRPQSIRSDGACGVPVSRRW